MTPEETIAALQRTKEVLFERGWNQGNFINSQGNVCVYGAARIACGATVTARNAYIVDPEDRAHGRWTTVATALDDVSPRAPYDGGRGHAPTFNDAKTTRFEDIIDLVDRAIIAEKEKPNAGA